MGECNYEPLIKDMVWSYSRIKSFNDCPYKWYLKYICHFDSHKHMFFSDYGTFVHELIASFLSGEKTASQVRYEYLTNFKKRVLGRAPNEKIFKKYFADGIAYLKQLTAPINKVIGVEKEVSFQIGDRKFTGFIDILLEDDNGYIIIVDNKSRNLKPRSKRKKPTISDAELDDYLRQLYLYSIPVIQEYGKYPSKLCFNCFREQIFIEEPFSKEKLDETIQWCNESIERILKETDFRPNMEYFKCLHLCEMQDRCEFFELSRKR